MKGAAPSIKNSPNLARSSSSSNKKGLLGFSSMLSLVSSLNDKGDKEIDEDGPEAVLSKMLIGSNRVDPLVSLDDLQAHLKLLSAFGALRDGCFQGKSNNIKTGIDQVWTAFLHRANHRFTVYLDKILTWSNLGVSADNRTSERMLNLDQEKAQQMLKKTHCITIELLPPLDVAMMWHAYRLNPGRLMEDATRVPSLRILSLVNFPLQMLSNHISSTDKQLRCKEAEVFWTRATNHSWKLNTLISAAPIESTQGPDQGLVVQCPICCESSAGPCSQFLSWNMLSDPQWKFNCQQCSVKVDAKVLKGATFMRDLKVWLADEQTTDNYRMRGGLLSPRNGKYFPDDPHAPVLCRLYDYKREVSTHQEGMDALVRFPPRYGKEAAIMSQYLKNVDKLKPSPILKPRKHFEQAKGDILELSHIIMMETMDREAVAHEKIAIDLRRRLSLLFKFYFEGNPFTTFSVDLVDAVKRQFSFVDEMNGMGWTQMEHIDSKYDAPQLANAIIRYHKWFHVLCQKKELMCPTLDIDLAWHTHQLSALYYNDCFRVVGCFIDHDDKIEVTMLANAFDKTGRMWFEMYNQPYSICGCAVYTSSNLFQSLSLKLKSKSAKHKGENDAFNKDVSKGSHPSIHNLTVNPHSSTSRAGNSIRKTREIKDMETGQRKRGHSDVFM